MKTAAATALALCLAAAPMPAAAADGLRGMGGAVVELLKLKREMAVIRTEAELNHCLADLASRLQERAAFYFAGPLRGKERQAMLRSRWQDYCKGFSLTRHPDGSVILRLFYKDSARMLAAHRDPSLLPKLEAREALALEKAQDLASRLVAPGMSDMDKALALHDGLVRHARYQEGSGSDEAATLLLEGTGVCEAYSRALYLLLNMAGVPCHIVSGSANGAPHSWNLAKTGGEWSHIDATWDDPVTDDGRDALTHAWFLLNDRQMARSHAWERGSLPPSAEKDALYFRENQRYFTHYADLWQGAIRAIAQGESEYEAWLTAYGDRETFKRQLRDARLALPALNAIRSWSGPEAEEGAIRLDFGHSDAPALVAEEALRLARKTADKACSRLRTRSLAPMLEEAVRKADTQYLMEEGACLFQETGEKLHETWERIQRFF